MELHLVPLGRRLFDLCLLLSVALRLVAFDHTISGLDPMSFEDSIGKLTTTNCS